VTILVAPTLGDRWRIRIKLDAHAAQVARPPAGLDIEVEGPDETIVEGLALRLHHCLRPGTRRLDAMTLEAVTLPAWAASFAVATTLVKRLHAGHDWILLAVVLVLAGMVGLHWAAPSLELLPPGGRTRLRRFGAVIHVILLGVLVWLITTGISALAGQAAGRF
jgi:hypothetical protein